MAQAPYWCCCDGGGGGDDCCICGGCYFAAPSPPDFALRSATSLFNITGEVAGLCCRPVGPASTECTVLEHYTLLPSAAFQVELARPGSSKCEVDGGGFKDAVVEVEDCFGDPRDINVQANLILRSSVTTGGINPTCPSFYLPRAGAVWAWTSGGETLVLVWSGGRCTGPMMMAESHRALSSMGGVSLAPSYVFAVADSEGNSASLAMIRLVCSNQPSLSGCTANDDSCGGIPTPISGGASSSGLLSCTGQTFQVSGGGSYSFEAVCETGGEACFAKQVDGEWCYGFPVTRTAPTSVDFNFDFQVDLAGLMEQCPPGPRDSSEGGPFDEPGDGLFVLVPQEWLAASEPLSEAVGLLRAYLEPTGTQTPPPGGVRPGGDQNAAAIEGAEDRNPMQRCRGCGG